MTGPGLDLSRLCRDAFLIRKVEERLLELFSAGRLSGTTHTSIGQEDVALGILRALDCPEDIVFSNHRCHGHYLAYGGPLEGLLAEIMGRPQGVCGGQGGSQHLCWKQFRTNGIQGGIVPNACGLALAEKLRGSGRVVCVFIGDGTLGEGVVYETLNLASLWRLPLLVVLEDNGYAQTTPRRLGVAGSIPGRFACFGIPVAEVASGDVLGIHAAAREAVAAMRAGEGPRAIVAATYRLAPHSKGDDTRAAGEVAAAWRDDPLRKLAALLPPELAAQCEAEAARMLDEAMARIDAQGEGAAVLATEGLGDPLPCAYPLPACGPGDRVVDRLNAGLHAAFRSDGKVFLLGEDLLDPYGGAFKVARGLSSTYPDRVLTTPISEAALVGLASGAALGGLRPVAEIMFGDFCTLAFDQILNHAAKFRWIYNGQAQVPMVLRTPMGGRRGYGATHSQSLEKHFLGIPGLRTVAVTAYADPAETLLTCLSQEDPVLLVENKAGYAQPLAQAPAGFTRVPPSRPLGPVRLVPEGGAPDLTLVAYGGMDDCAVKAAQLLLAEEIRTEVLILQQLAPGDAWLPELLAAAGRSRRLIVCEEGCGPWGFGAEVLARVAESPLGRQVECRRVAAPPVPIPSSRALEKQMLPDERTLVAMATRMLLGDPDPSA